MSFRYRAARDFLIGRIEALTLENALDLKDTLKHDPELRPGSRAPARSRTFLWRTLQGAAREVLTPGRDRGTRTVEIRVCYRMHVRFAELEAHIVEDARRITRAILDNAEGDTENEYGIVEVHDGSEFAFPFDIEWPDDDPQGAAWLALQFPLEVDEAVG